MERDKLIRAHFEASRDLTWAQILEPKFRERGVDAVEMKGYREAWNLHVERRDWGWWENEVKSYSTADLQDMLADCIEKLDALGMLQWRRDKSEAEDFRRVLNASPEKGAEEEEKQQERSKGRDM